MLKSSRILVYNKKKSGQGFLIAPGQVTTYRADEQEPWEYTWIEFDGLRAHEALNLAGISGQNPCTRLRASKPDSCCKIRYAFRFSDK